MPFDCVCSSKLKWTDIHLPAFQPFWHGRLFLTPCLLSCTRSPSEKRSTLKGKNLLPKEQILSFLSRPLFRREATTVWPLSFWTRLFQLWNWTHPLLEKGITVKQSEKNDNQFRSSSSRFTPFAITLSAWFGLQGWKDYGECLHLQWRPIPCQIIGCLTCFQWKGFFICSGPMLQRQHLLCYH